MNKLVIEDKSYHEGSVSVSVDGSRVVAVKALLTIYEISRRKSILWHYRISPTVPFFIISFLRMRMCKISIFSRIFQ